MASRGLLIRGRIVEVKELSLCVRMDWGDGVFYFPLSQISNLLVGGLPYTGVEMKPDNPMKKNCAVSFEIPKWLAERMMIT